MAIHAKIMKSTATIATGLRWSYCGKRMETIFTDDEILTAKSDWEADLREFASVTTATLQHARKLPIYDHAIDRATVWLRQALAGRIYRRKHHTLVIAGDEHLQAAVERVGLPDDSLFLHQTAWRYWYSGRYLGKACWWQSIDWAINCPYRMIDLSSPHNRNLTLLPNKTFLCSEEVAGRGTHTILSIESDGTISSSSYSEWLVS